MKSTPPSTLPPPTPTLHALPPVESASPVGAFVSVFTPTAPNGVPTTEELDANGITVGAWAAPLHATRDDWKTRYFWMVACCPCVPVAQLEMRLGWSDSYGRAVLRHAFAYAVFVAFFVANVYTLAQLFTGARAICLEIFLLVCLVVCAVLVSRRVGQMRTEVRTRFAIDGSEKDDQYVACMHSSRTIRQLGKHLQCDRAVLRRAPTTLPAYHV